MQASVRSPSPWLWLAAAVAFSPALADLTLHALSTPRAIAPLLAAVLLVVGTLRTRAPVASNRPAAIALLAFAASLEVFGIVGGIAALARASVAVALVAMAQLVGRPPLSTALLSLWLVPIPVSLLEPVRGPIEHAVAAFVAAVAGLASPGIVAVGPIVRAGGVSFEIDTREAGLHLAHLLALLGWYGAARRGGEPRTAAWSAAKAALLVLPLQPLFLVLAAIALVIGGPGAARALLTILPVVVASVGVWRAERQPLR
jgi:hypothetical protein